MILRALLLLLFFALPHAGRGQSDKAQTGNGDESGVSVRLGGTIQPRVAYAFDAGDSSASGRVGFGVRRLRLTMNTVIDHRILIFVQMEGAPPSGVRLLDMRLGYRFTDSWLIRGGRFIGAQPRSFAQTLQSEIDAIERATIAMAWASQTVGADGRTFGIEVVFQHAEWEVKGSLHNGYNDDNFRTFVDDKEFVTAGRSTLPASGLSLIHRSTRAKGLEAGFYAGHNPSGNPNTELDGTGRRYADFSSHLYWGSEPGSRPLRLKADLIGIIFDRIDPLIPGSPARRQDFLGWSALGAWAPIKPLETFIRLERYGQHTENADRFRKFLTAGLTFSRSALSGEEFKNQRATLAYSNRFSSLADEGVRHSVVLQLQIVF